MTKKISVVITVFNEDGELEKLLNSLKTQALLPAEVVVVNAGESLAITSKDYPSLNLKVIDQKCNRSQGRNLGVELAKNEWIAITDAGCVADKNWLKQLWAKREEVNADVVGGIHLVKDASDWQLAVAPYILVMPDKFDEHTFLPATRSMLISKKVWRQFGGLNEKLTVSEDYEFVRRLKAGGAQIAATSKAIIYWQPYQNAWQLAKAVYGFAKFDAQMGLRKIHTLSIFGRYLGAVSLLAIMSIVTSNWIVAVCLTVLELTIYAVWVVIKNATYTTGKKYLFCLVQIITDLSVMLGYLVGMFGASKNIRIDRF